MALIWQKLVGETLYEVRSAGNSIRLYTDGVFHSQFNHQRPFSGQIWDLLSIPSVFYKEVYRPKRILVLGVGGGAVIQQLKYLLSPDVITGIELDPTHLTIAKRFFKTNGNNIQLVNADARAWIDNYCGESFDMIIDDVFGEENGEPVRAIEADTEWMKQLSDLLSTRGMLVCNFPERKELVNCGVFTSRALRTKFPSVFQLSTPHTYNRVGVFLTRSATPQQLRDHLKSKVNKVFKTAHLRYTIRTLK